MDNKVVFSTSARTVQAAFTLFFLTGILVPGRCLGQASYGLSFGFSNIDVEAGTTYSQSTGMGTELRPEMNLPIANFNTALNVYYQGRLGSSIGGYPLGRLGAGLKYYPMGFAIKKTIMDQGVVVTSNNLVVFVSAGTELANVSVSDTHSSTEPIYFNGLLLGLQLAAGLEFPMGQNWALVLQGIKESTLTGGKTGGDSASLNISGMNFLLGLTFYTAN